MAIYAALKAAVSNLVINLASQFGKDGVTVNNIAPGVVETARNQEALADAQYADQVRQKIPLGYFGQPHDYSGIALLLCSEAGRYITGRSEEHTSELQSLMRISYAVFCLKKKKKIRSELKTK